MADVNASIHIGINSSAAMGELAAMQAKMAALNKSMATGAAASTKAQLAQAAAMGQMLNRSGQWTAAMQTMQTATGRMAAAFDKGTVSSFQQYRKNSKAFSRDHSAINQLAAQRVRALQTQYAALGREVDGTQKVMKMQPTGMMREWGADAMFAQQKAVLFRRNLEMGANSMVNWGKNTQWAGRQMMVGMGIPMALAAAGAVSAFRDIETASISFKRVYGDATTSSAEKAQMLGKIQSGVAQDMTKYGIAVSDTLDVAAKAAATGQQGDNLVSATRETMRLATLGQLDYDQALQSTIATQTAFGVSAKGMTRVTDFLNAAENQTILSMDDMTKAIPRVAPVIRGLGGDVEDLGVLMTALRAGGVTAEQGANALKSGLASLINPTSSATEAMESLGIPLDKIVQANKGDLIGTVQDFGKALKELPKFEQQQALESLFGKYQYARMGALFRNINSKQAKETARLSEESNANLAKMSENELGQIADSALTQFQGAIERLKAAAAPLGEQVLRTVTPMIDGVSKLLGFFANNDAARNVALFGLAFAGLAGVATMITGVFANFFGTMTKGALLARRGLDRMMGRSLPRYSSIADLEAAAAAKQLGASAEGAAAGLYAEANAAKVLSEALTLLDAKQTAVIANNGMMGPGGTGGAVVPKTPVKPSGGAGGAAVVQKAGQAQVKPVDVMGNTSNTFLGSKNLNEGLKRGIYTGNQVMSHLAGTPVASRMAPLMEVMFQNAKKVDPSSVAGFAHAGEWANSQQGSQVRRALADGLDSALAGFGDSIVSDANITDPVHQAQKQALAGLGLDAAHPMMRALDMANQVTYVVDENGKVRQIGNAAPYNSGPDSVAKLIDRHTSGASADDMVTGGTRLGTGVGWADDTRVHTGGVRNLSSSEIEQLAQQTGSRNTEAQRILTQAQARGAVVIDAHSDAVEESTKTTQDTTKKTKSPNGGNYMAGFDGGKVGQAVLSDMDKKPQTQSGWMRQGGAFTGEQANRWSNRLFGLGMASDMAIMGLSSMGKEMPMWSHMMGMGAMTLGMFPGLVGKPAKALGESFKGFVASTKTSAGMMGKVSRGAGGAFKALSMLAPAGLGGPIGLAALGLAAVGGTAYLLNQNQQALIAKTQDLARTYIASEDVVAAYANEVGKESISMKEDRAVMERVTGERMTQAEAAKESARLQTASGQAILQTAKQAQELGNSYTGMQSIVGQVGSLYGEGLLGKKSALNFAMTLGQSLGLQEPQLIELRGMIGEVTGKGVDSPIEVQAILSDLQLSKDSLSAGVGAIMANAGWMDSLFAELGAAFDSKGGFGFLWGEEHMSGDQALTAKGYGAQAAQVGRQNPATSVADLYASLNSLGLTARQFTEAGSEMNRQIDSMFMSSGVALAAGTAAKDMADVSRVRGDGYARGVTQIKLSAAKGDISSDALNNLFSQNEGKDANVSLAFDGATAEDAKLMGQILSEKDSNNALTSNAKSLASALQGGISRESLIPKLDAYNELGAGGKSIIVDFAANGVDEINAAKQSAKEIESMPGNIDKKINITVSDAAKGDMKEALNFINNFSKQDINKALNTLPDGKISGIDDALKVRDAIVAANAKPLPVKLRQEGKIQAPKGSGQTVDVKARASKITVPKTAPAVTVKAKAEKVTIPKDANNTVRVKAKADKVTVPKSTNNTISVKAKVANVAMPKSTDKTINVRGRVTDIQVPNSTNATVTVKGQLANVDTSGVGDVTVPVKPESLPDAEYGGGEVPVPTMPLPVPQATYAGGPVYVQAVPLPVFATPAYLGGPIVVPVVTKKAAGGYVAGFADGGSPRQRFSGRKVSGPGGPTDDKVPAWLSNGEFVMRAAAVKKYGLGFMHDANALRLAKGGDGKNPDKGKDKEKDGDKWSWKKDVSKPTMKEDRIYNKAFSMLDNFNSRRMSVLNRLIEADNPKAFEKYKNLDGKAKKKFIRAIIRKERNAAAVEIKSSFAESDKSDALQLKGIKAKNALAKKTKSYAEQILQLTDEEAITLNKLNKKQRKNFLKRKASIANRSESMDARLERMQADKNKIREYKSMSQGERYQEASNQYQSLAQAMNDAMGAFGEKAIRDKFGKGSAWLQAETSREQLRADRLSHSNDLEQRKIDDINEAYDAQAKILEKAQAAQQSIANLEKARLGVAGSLASGDVAAAAAAMQEAKQTQAQFAQEQMRAGLDAEREARIKAHQSVIDANQDTIDSISDSIWEITQSISETQADAVLLGAAMADEYEAQNNHLMTQQSYWDAILADITKAQGLLGGVMGINLATYGKETTETKNTDNTQNNGAGGGNPPKSNASTPAEDEKRWERFNKSFAKLNAKDKSLVIKEAFKGITDTGKNRARFKGWGDAKQNEILNYIDKGKITEDEAKKLRKFAKGGWVTGYGSGDKVPALLTPGEFVVNKLSAQKFGGALESLNSPSFRFAAAPGMASPNGAVGYNGGNTYALTFNMSNTSADVNQLADAVVRRIESVDSRGIRSRGW